MYKNTMDIIKAFQKNEIGINITIKGTHESPLFRASDIGEVLDIGNIRPSIQEFDNTEKHAVSLTDSMGRNQNVTFLTVKGLKKIICKTRKPKGIELAKKLGIDVYDIMHVPLETSVVNFITTVFNKEEHKTQFSVGKYKIDLYFTKLKLAIECDECFHIFQKEEDQIREKYIIDKLDCKFLRYKQKDDLAKFISVIKIEVDSYKFYNFCTEIHKLGDENEKLKSGSIELRLKVIELETKLANNTKDVELEKLKVRKQELDLKYTQNLRIKNSFTLHRLEDGIEQKFCPGILCREESGEDGKWLCVDNFGKSDQNKDGFRTECKKCRNVSERSYYERKDNKMTEEELKESDNKRSMKLRVKLTDGKKKCTKCDSMKDIDEYEKIGVYITGECKYRSDCRECRKIQKRKKKPE